MDCFLEVKGDTRVTIPVKGPWVTIWQAFMGFRGAVGDPPPQVEAQDSSPLFSMTSLYQWALFLG